METSYLARFGKFANPVCISAKVPDWYHGNSYEPLAPPFWLINERDPVVYEEKFRKVILSKLDPRKVVQDLGENATLLCYEKDATNCHRRIVAKWLGEKLGIEVIEHEWPDWDEGSGLYIPKEQLRLEAFL